MRRVFAFALFYAAALSCMGAPRLAAPGSAQAQVTDRIVARIEDDIITLSEERELTAYQQLVDGKSEPQQRLLQELIEQWAIANEAQSAQFPQPSKEQIDRQLQQIESRFADRETFQRRLAELGLTAEELRQLVNRQIYLTSYVDYRFRPAVDVEEEAIEAYYKGTLAPALETAKQTVPPLESVTEQIREVLVAKGISQRVDMWLDETKARLRIEVEPAANAASGTKP